MNLIFSLAKIKTGTFESLFTILAAIIVIVCVVALPIVFFAVNALVAKFLSNIAKSKGHNPLVPFLLCFLLGLPGYFYVAALPDLKKHQQIEKIINLLQVEKEPVDSPEPEPHAAEETPDEK